MHRQLCVRCQDCGGGNGLLRRIRQGREDGKSGVGTGQKDQAHEDAACDGIKACLAQEKYLKTVKEVVFENEKVNGWRVKGKQAERNGAD